MWGLLSSSSGGGGGNTTIIQSASNIVSSPLNNLPNVLAEVLSNGDTVLQFLQASTSNFLRLDVRLAEWELQDIQASNPQITGMSFFDQDGVPLVTITDNETELIEGDFLINLNGAGDTFVFNQSSGTFIPETDYCGIDTYVKSKKDLRVILSNEGTGTSNITVKINGSSATWEQLDNAIDNGSGNITFLGAGNQVFSKRATSNQALKNVGDTAEVTMPAEAQFDSSYLTLAPVGAQAEIQGNFMRLQIAASGYNLFDKNGNNVATGNAEQGVYLFTRTLYGFKVERDGVQIYNEPEFCEDASEVLSAITGEQAVSRHDAVINIGTNTPVATGHDLTQATGMKLKIFFRDQANDKPWPITEIDVDAVLAISAASTNDGFVHIFDNDYLTMNIVDAANGDVTFTQAGRDMEYVWSELVKKTPASEVEISIAGTEGRRDIGSSREMWGQANSSSTVEQVVTLPEPFLNADYNLQLTAFPGVTANRVVTIIAKTPTTFTMRNIAFGDGTLQAEPVSWRAIGLKP